MFAIESPNRTTRPAARDWGYAPLIHISISLWASFPGRRANIAEKRVRRCCSEFQHSSLRWHECSFSLCDQLGRYSMVVVQYLFETHGRDPWGDRTQRQVVVANGTVRLCEVSCEAGCETTSRTRNEWLITLLLLPVIIRCRCERDFRSFHTGDLPGWFADVWVSVACVRPRDLGLFLFFFCISVLQWQQYISGFLCEVTPALSAGLLSKIFMMCNEWGEVLFC